MKPLFPKQTASTSILALLAAVFLLAATTLPAAEKTAPPTAPKSPPPAQQVDTNTGLPVQPPPWIDPNWADPDKKLAEVLYDAMPVSEVAQHLIKEFNRSFDVLIPNRWQDPSNRALSVEAPYSVSISMQLRNVTASEVFNAMNMKFEAENAPYRWELKLNGSRQIAMLRILPQLLHHPEPPPPPATTTRMVYFVGDLIDDQKIGSMTMEQLVKTVTEVYKMSFGESQNVIRFHKESQLLIVTGTTEQAKFIQSTLAALRERAQQPNDGPKLKLDAPKVQ